MKKVISGSEMIKSLCEAGILSNLDEKVSIKKLEISAETNGDAVVTVSYMKVDENRPKNHIEP